VLSVHVLPSLPGTIFFEAESPQLINSVVASLHNVPLPQVKIAVPGIVSDFCNFTRLAHLYQGRFIRVVGTEFADDYAKVIRVSHRKGHVLVKVRPRIDYLGIQANNCPSQAAITAAMSPDYRPPQAWFNEVGLVALGAVVRGGPARMCGFPIELRYWDGKFFSGRWQITKISTEAVQTEGISVPDDVIIAFNECGVTRSWVDHIPSPCGFAVFGEFSSNEISSSQSDLSNVEDTSPQSSKDISSSRMDFEQVATQEPRPESLDVEELLKSKMLAQKSWERPPSAFSIGYHVTPVSGRFAGLPCQVESTDLHSVGLAAQWTGRISWVPAKVLEPLASTRVDDAVQAAQSTSAASLWTSFQTPPPPTDHQTVEVMVEQQPSFRQLRPGDLVRRSERGLAIVIGPDQCRDTENHDHPLPRELNEHVFDEATQDSRHNKIDIGDTVTIIHGKHAGATGTIVRMTGQHVFLSIDGNIVAVASHNIHHSGEDTRETDIIGEEIVIINRNSLSQPFPILRIERDGGIRLRGSEMIVHFCDYGSKWRFATELGIASNDMTDSGIRKKR
jgi:hypothetical protein